MASTAAAIALRRAVASPSWAALLPRAVCSCTAARMASTHTAAAALTAPRTAGASMPAPQSLVTSVLAAASVGPSAGGNPFAWPVGQVSQISHGRGGKAAGVSKRQIRRLKGHKGRPLPPVPPSEPLKWTPAKVELLSSGWAPPTGETPADLPFRVRRTELGQQIPVYTDYRNGRTRVLTLIRRVEGDREALAEELRKVCGGVDVKVLLGRVEVKGLFRRRVIDYLRGLGF